MNFKQVNQTTLNNNIGNGNNSNNSDNLKPASLSKKEGRILDFLEEKGVAIIVVQPLISGGVMIYGKEVEIDEAKSLISQIKQNPNYFEKVIGVSNENEEEELIDVFELPDGSLVEAVAPAHAKTAKVVKARKNGDGNLQKVI